MKRFVILTLITAGIIVFGVVFGVSQRYFSSPSFFKEIIIFLAFSNILLYSFSKQKANEAPTDFIKIYLGSTVLKILFFGAFIFTVMRMDMPGASGNTALFLISYFVFTILEITILFLEINSQNSPNRRQKDL